MQYGMISWVVPLERFRSLDAMALDVVGVTIDNVTVEDHIVAYERSRS